MFGSVSLVGTDPGAWPFFSDDYIFLKNPHKRLQRPRNLLVKAAAQTL